MKFLAVTETKILIFKMHPFKYDSVLAGMEQYVCQGVLGARGMFNILTKTHMEIAQWSGTWPHSFVDKH